MANLERGTDIEESYLKHEDVESSTSDEEEGEEGEKWEEKKDVFVPRSSTVRSRQSHRSPILKTKPLIAGHLNRYVNKFKGWKPFWFTLNESRLCYSGEKDAVIYKEIDITNARIAERSDKNLDNSFEIITDSQKKFVLQADSRPSMDAWVASLRKATELTKEIASDSLDNLHRWYYAPASKKFAFCNVCSGVVGRPLVCEVCHLLVHKRCIARVVYDCKWTTRETVPPSCLLNNGELSHQWISGNLSKGSKCSVCTKPCGSSKKLIDFRCLWCMRTVHGVCQLNASTVCDLSNRPAILSPASITVSQELVPLGLANAAISPTDSFTGSLAHDLLTRVRIAPSQHALPLLVLVNPRSGSNNGVKVMRMMRHILNPLQVFDVTQGGPSVGLQIFKDCPQFRVLSCGGDGTVGWILTEADKLGISNFQVAVLPLGTGNDLARVLGWGSSFTEDEASLIAYLDSLDYSKVTPLDRWSLKLSHFRHQVRFVYDEIQFSNKFIEDSDTSSLYPTLGSDATSRQPSQQPSRHPSRPPSRPPSMPPSPNAGRRPSLSIPLDTSSSTDSNPFTPHPPPSDLLASMKRAYPPRNQEPPADFLRPGSRPVSRHASRPPSLTFPMDMTSSGTNTLSKSGNNLELPGTNAQARFKDPLTEEASYFAPTRFGMTSDMQGVRVVSIRRNNPLARLNPQALLEMQEESSLVNSIDERSSGESSNDPVPLDQAPSYQIRSAALAITWIMSSLDSTDSSNACVTLTKHCDDLEQLALSLEKEGKFKKASEKISTLVSNIRILVFNLSNEKLANIDMMAHDIRRELQTLIDEHTPHSPRSSLNAKHDGEEAPLPELETEINVINNYFGIGLDAKICLDFNTLRDDHPEKCRSRVKNQMWYGILGTKELIQQSCKDMHHRILLECDGVPVPLPKLQGIVLLNISSYMGGTNFWGNKKDKTFHAPGMADGYIEVVGVKDGTQMAAAKALQGKLTPTRLAQARSVKIIITSSAPVPVQVDGEAWMQEPCTLTITHKDTAQLLTRLKKYKDFNQNNVGSSGTLPRGTLPRQSSQEDGSPDPQEDTPLMRLDSIALQLLSSVHCVCELLSSQVEELSLCYNNLSQARTSLFEMDTMTRMGIIEYVGAVVTILQKIAEMFDIPDDGEGPSSSFPDPIDFPKGRTSSPSTPVPSSPAPTLSRRVSTLMQEERSTLEKTPPHTPTMEKKRSFSELKEQRKSFSKQIEPAYLKGGDVISTDGPSFGSLSSDDTPLGTSPSPRTGLRKKAESSPEPFRPPAYPSLEPESSPTSSSHPLPSSPLNPAHSVESLDVQSSPSKSRTNPRSSRDNLKMGNSKESLISSSSDELSASTEKPLNPKISMSVLGDLGPVLISCYDSAHIEVERVLCLVEAVKSNSSDASSSSPKKLNFVQKMYKSLSNFTLPRRKRSSLSNQSNDSNDGKDLENAGSSNFISESNDKAELKSSLPETMMNQKLFDGQEVDMATGGAYFASDPPLQRKVSRKSRYSAIRNSWLQINKSVSPEPERKRPFELWGVDEVYQWLIVNDMENFANVFRKKNILGCQLLSLNASYLETLGFSIAEMKVFGDLLETLEESANEYDVMNPE